MKQNEIYTRQKKGHSVLVWFFIGIPFLWVPCIYFTLSPNHYWRAF